MLQKGAGGGGGGWGGIGVASRDHVQTRIQVLSNFSSLDSGFLHTGDGNEPHLDRHIGCFLEKMLEKLI